MGNFLERGDLLVAKQAEKFDKRKVVAGQDQHVGGGWAGSGCRMFLRSSAAGPDKSRSKDTECAPFWSFLRNGHPKDGPLQNNVPGLGSFKTPTDLPGCEDPLKLLDVGSVESA